MKSITRYFLLCALACSSLQADDAPPRNSPQFYNNLLGNASADATSTAIGMSMLGWGVGMAAFITALTILIPPENESTAHTHCDPGA